MRLAYGVTLPHAMAAGEFSAAVLGKLARAVYLPMRVLLPGPDV